MALCIWPSYLQLNETLHILLYELRLCCIIDERHIYSLTWFALLLLVQKSHYSVWLKFDTIIYIPEDTIYVQQS